jgi:hypothetical protein
VPATYKSAKSTASAAVVPGGEFEFGDESSLNEEGENDSERGKSEGKFHDDDDELLLLETPGVD